MSASRANFYEQNVLFVTDDILSLNFIFTKAFMEHYFDDTESEIAAYLVEVDVPQASCEEIDILIKISLCASSLEVKPRKTKEEVEADTQKLPCMMKIALNELIRASVQKAAVIGILSIGMIRGEYAPQVGSEGYGPPQLATVAKKDPPQPYAQYSKQDARYQQQHPPGGEYGPGGYQQGYQEVQYDQYSDVGSA
ncbi:hypothetical protein EC968_009987 [Mortierella alpina]|nr:hypothetical protein EC968_009987 [Mortierella alpina]